MGFALAKGLIRGLPKIRYPNPSSTNFKYLSATNTPKFLPVRVRMHLSDETFGLSMPLQASRRPSSRSFTGNLPSPILSPGFNRPLFRHALLNFYDSTNDDVSPGIHRAYRCIPGVTT